MIALKHVQDKARALIAADSFFNGIPVVCNLGTVSPMIEKALCDSACGVVVEVQPILGGVGETRGTTVISTVKFSVMVLINPVTNTTGKKVNVYEAIQRLIAAVLAYDKQPGEGNFEVDPEDQFGLDAIDEGLLSYTVSFVKKVQLS